MLIGIDLWRNIEFYISNPVSERSDFFSLGGLGAFACNKRALSELEDFLNFGCELLPIHLEDGSELYVINVLDCVNAMNVKASVFDYYDDGERGRILTYAFYPDRYTESSIFKIPETATTQILTYQGLKDPNDEFITAYSQTDLVGLGFTVLYDSDLR